MSAAPAAEHPARRLWHHARRFRGRLRLAAACSVLNKIFDLAPPLLIGAAVDVVVRREDSLFARWGVVDVRHQLWLLAGLTLAIWILESVFEYLNRILWRNAAQAIQHELRLEAYEHVQGLDAAWLDERGTGAVIAVLNDDVNQLERFLDGGADDLLQVTTTVLVVGAIFLGLAPQVAWMSLLLEPRYAAVRAEAGLLSFQLANDLGGLATIKSFTAERDEAARMRARSEAYRDANRSAIALSSAFSPLIRMVIVLGFVAMLVAGGMLALSGALAVGAYSVLVFLTQRLLWPLTRLGQTFDLYQRAMASTARVLDLLATPPTIRSGSRRLRAADVRGAVRLESVDFRYAEGPPVLEDLDLELPAGETTAIVGATGAGKTTIIKLLLRFHDPTAGLVTLDGTDVRELDLADLRRAIGLVSQDVFLFHGTVRENVAFGRRDAGFEDIVAACRLAEAHEFVERLARGYDTVVGERGQKLSGGQRQRLSIARAVLKDPPVLILDEATSSVDNETEAAIQRSLARLGESRTVIVIAHRLSTVRHAHRIHVLDAGRLVESGTHERLVGQDGLYAALWRVQAGEAVAPR
jgi:ATP-binding cassette subfamily B protein